MASRWPIAPSGVTTSISTDSGEVAAANSGSRPMRAWMMGKDYSPDGKWIYFNSDRSGAGTSGGCPRPARLRGRKSRTNHQGRKPGLVSAPVPGWKSLVFISFEKGIPDHPANKNVTLRMMPLPGRKAGVPKIREIVKLFGGQGTINVSSWSPDSKQFAYVSYELIH